MDICHPSEKKETETDVEITKGPLYLNTFKFLSSEGQTNLGHSSRPGVVLIPSLHVAWCGLYLAGIASELISWSSRPPSCTISGDGESRAVPEIVHIAHLRLYKLRADPARPHVPKVPNGGHKIPFHPNTILPVYKVTKSTKTAPLNPVAHHSENSTDWAKTPLSHGQSGRGKKYQPNPQKGDQLKPALHTRQEGRPSMRQGRAVCVYKALAPPLTQTPRWSLLPHKLLLPPSGSSKGNSQQHGG